MRTHPKIRPATAKDLEKYYGEPLRWSARAVVADRGGEILGVGGIYYCGDLAVAFSSFKPEMRDYPVAMARGTLKIMDIVKKRVCVAFADGNIDGSDNLLIRLGFERREGGYLWKSQSPS